MWPFRNTRSSKENVREAFSRYISKEVLDEIVRHPEKQAELRRAKTAYLIFQIRDDVLDDVATNLDRSLRIALNSDGFVDSVLSSMVLITFDFRDDEERVIKLNKRAISIGRLLHELESNIKIVYGVTEIMRGPIGAGQILRYGSLAGNLAKSIEALTKLRFGVAAEA
jgi:hypothetical protein